MWLQEPRSCSQSAIMDLEKNIFCLLIVTTFAVLKSQSFVATILFLCTAVYTTHYTLHTNRYIQHAAHCTLQTSKCTLRAAHYSVQQTYFFLGDKS